jgi:4-hydroxy-2-oxoheptanedioate aldolase
MPTDGRGVVPAWMTRKNSFKQALSGAQPPITMWVTTSWLGVIETLGAAGADAAIIDLEHVSYGLEEAERLIVSCEAAGISPLVRPPGLEPELISRVLDAGAQGIVFAQVEDAEQAALAISCLRYRPHGIRGWGGAHTRYAGWQGGYAGDLLSSGRGGGVYTTEYVQKACDDVVAILLVETVRGVEQIDAIAAVPGVDAVIFGWGDYSVEVGFDGERCRTAAAAVRAACHGQGVGVALTPGEAPYPGCFRIAGVDSLHMSAGLTMAVQAARGEAEVPAAVSSVVQR